MNRSLRKKLLYIITICALAVLAGAVFLWSPKRSTVAYADVVPDGAGAEQEFIVVDRSQDVQAEFAFVRLNDSECSVRIANKTEATVAVIPKETAIDGVTYKVTEIASNGFLSSPKLREVKMLSNIKKIGGSAFGNCASLQKVTMGNVQVIEKNAFYRCPKLEKIVLPHSVTTLGANVFRSNSTRVMARADEAGAGWSSTWNSGNEVQDVEYGSKYKEPLELQEVYASSGNARSDNGTVFVGYELTDGQPRTEDFYDEEGSDIFIPSKYNGEDIIGIVSYAFELSAFDQLIVEYSDKPIYIGSEAFALTECRNIVINRSVEYENENYGLDLADTIFGTSQVDSVVLPNDIPGLADFMFVGCENLTNVYFNEPKQLDRASELKLVEDLSANAARGVVYLPQSESFSYIGEGAFDSTTSIKEMHIYDTVKTVYSAVTANWVDTQCVYVHNDNVRIRFSTDVSDGVWHIDCFGGNEKVVFTSTYYTVTLDFDDGATQPETIDVKLGAAVGTLPRSERENYDFMGWLGDDGNYYSADTVYTAERDMTFTAQWSAHTYTVGYEANYPSRAKGERSGDMSDKEFVCGGEFALSENAFVLQGWTFTGWNTAPDGSGASVEDAISAAKKGDTITFYAQWKANKYRVGYELGDGGVNHKDNPAEFESDTAVELNEPSRANHDFKRWDIKKAFVDEILVENAKKIENIYQDIKLVAVWEKIGSDRIILTAQETGITLSVYETHVILPSGRFDSSCYIRVGSGVKKLKFVGTENIVYKMNIEVEDRDSGLDMTLKNCKIEAPNGYDAIYMPSAYTLTLTVNGVCSLRGGDSTKRPPSRSIGEPSHFAISALNGFAGLRCYKLLLILNENFSITGGNGARGRNGASGTPIGQDGGTGGAGGAALIVSSVSDVRGNMTLTLTGGDGGDGGDGGVGIALSPSDTPKGGAGGFGGAAGSAISGKLNKGDCTLIEVSGKFGKRGSNGFVSTAP